MRSLVVLPDDISEDGNFNMSKNGRLVENSRFWIFFCKFSRGVHFIFSVFGMTLHPFEKLNKEVGWR